MWSSSSPTSSACSGGGDRFSAAAMSTVGTASSKH
jgi:hypothetical protein